MEEEQLLWHRISAERSAPCRVCACVCVFKTPFSLLRNFTFGMEIFTVPEYSQLVGLPAPDWQVPGYLGAEPQRGISAGNHAYGLKP